MKQTNGTIDDLQVEGVKTITIHPEEIKPFSSISTCLLPSPRPAGFFSACPGRFLYPFWAHTQAESGKSGCGKEVSERKPFNPEQNTPCGL